MKIIEVSNCQECPFVVIDNEYGYCACNISEIVSNSLKTWEELPKTRRHELCELDKLEVLVKAIN